MNTYFQGHDILRIQIGLDAFLPGESCEAIKPPSPESFRQVTLAPDLPSFMIENRVERHIHILKCLWSKSKDTKMIMAIFDRIWALVVKFEVDMLASRVPDELLLRGTTRRALAITKFLELSGNKEIWLKEKLRTANRLMILLEDQPRYISELKHDKTSK